MGSVESVARLLVFTHQPGSTRLEIQLMFFSFQQFQVIRIRKTLNSNHPYIRQVNEHSQNNYRISLKWEFICLCFKFLVNGREKLQLRTCVPSLSPVEI